ncbi:hypothetical protein ACFE04_011222 [Oxalis oulophora]
MSSFPNHPDKNDVIEIENHPDDEESPKTLTQINGPDTIKVKRKMPKTRKKRKLVHQQKKWEKKVEVLLQNFKPLPFIPSKRLDFAKHETLLKRLGLWDFVHMEFDRLVRKDLVAQLIVSFSCKEKWSCVNGFRVKVSRADLARALYLPVKKGNYEDEETISGSGSCDVESKRFMEDLLSTYVLLHEDTWMMPKEIINYTNAVREGEFEKVDWAGLIWFMVERELKVSYDEVETSYYASHMQCLIKFQRGHLLEDESETRDVIDVKEEDDDDDDDDVRMDPVDAVDVIVEPKLEEEEIIDACNTKVVGFNVEKSNATMEVDCSNIESGDPKREADDVKLEIGKAEQKNVQVKVVDMDMEPGKSLEEHSIELSLGGKNNSPAEVFVEKSLEESTYAGDQSDTVLEFDECKVEKEEKQGGSHGQWLLGQKTNLSNSFLQRCNLGLSELKEERNLQEEEDDMDQQEENEEKNEDSGFHISPKYDNLDGMTSTNLISSMENDVQIPFCSIGLQIRDDLPGDFLAGNCSGFANGDKRAFEHENNDLSHDTFNGTYKRVRTHSSRNDKSDDASEVLDQAQNFIGKARNIVAEKDKALEVANMNEQMLLDEIHARDNIIEQLQKAKLDEQHKTQMEVYRLDCELYTMRKLLEGYRKALKETQRTFLEYREKCPVLHEPLYKDIPNSGGLVSSVMEIERQRVKQEDEDRTNRLFFEKKIKDFEDGLVCTFDTCKSTVDSLDIRLRSAKNEVKLIKNSVVKNQKSDVSERECTAPEDA